MKRIKNACWVSMTILLLLACNTMTTVSFLCQQEDLQIYVNQEYVGKGLVHYSAPKGINIAHVECKKDGITVYERTYNIKGANRILYDIHIPDHNTYSSDRQIHSK